jgi:uncharacterized membrane protein
VLLSAFLIGVIAGFRGFTPPVALGWAARSGWLDLSGSPLAFLGYRWTPWIFTALAVFELISDQRPTTPSRTVPVQFGTRILMGGLCGAALGASGGALVSGLIAGVAGSIVGTLGGKAMRSRMAAAFGSDRPAALIEDAIAIAGAVLIVMH